MSYYGLKKLKGKSFKYMLVTGPLDFFTFTLSSNQINDNMEYYSPYLSSDTNFESLEDGINSVIYEIEKELPHTIRYTSIPKISECDFDLVAIAKIYNNGTCFIFSDDLRYLKFINSINEEDLKETSSIEDIPF